MRLDEIIWGEIVDREEGFERVLRYYNNYLEVGQKSKYQLSILRMRGQEGRRRIKSRRVLSFYFQKREKCF